MRTAALPAMIGALSAPSAKTVWLAVRFKRHPSKAMSASLSASIDEAALAAARALIDLDLDAEAIVKKSLTIAAEICVYTNGNLTIESLDTDQKSK